MPIKAILVFGLLLSAFSSAQEVWHVDVTGIPEKFPDISPSERYVVCGTVAARIAKRSVRVSIESFSPTAIDPKQKISVVLKVENDGRLPVKLPVSGDVSVLQAQTGAVQYHAEFPINGAVGGQSMAIMGWLHLYGSNSKPETIVTLKPGEWVTLRGETKIHRWFPGQVAEAYAELQLYEWLSPSNSISSGEGCVKQSPGSSIAVRYKGPNESP